MTHRLSLKEVTFRHRGAPSPVLDDVSVNFDAGTATLITGPVGSGKSTLIHLLASLIRPDAGEIRADDRPVSRFTAPHRDKWRRDVGIIFQKTALFETRTVLENIMLPLYPLGSPYTDNLRRAETAIADLGMTAHSGARVATLSGGERQRTAIARALVSAPAFLLADEPTAHLDGAGTKALCSLVEREKSSGSVVIVVSHDPRLNGDSCFDGRYTLSNGSLSLSATR